jgi:hypothetical protein
MKRSLKAAVIAAVFASCAAAAHAETFDFSYTFADGAALTGSLDGTLNGDLITNISGVTVDFGGASFGATVFAGKNNADGSVDFSPNAAVVSTNGALNDFVFSDGHDPFLADATSAFAFNGPAGTVEAFNTNLLTNNTEFEGAVAGNWEIKPVPVPAALPLLMSGMGLLAAARRRRQAQAA